MPDTPKQAAARAASVFVLTVLALRVAAEDDPGWWQALAVFATSPDLLATAAVITVLARQPAGPCALDVQRN